MHSTLCRDQTKLISTSSLIQNGTDVKKIKRHGGEVEGRECAFYFVFEYFTPVCGKEVCLHLEG